MGIKFLTETEEIEFIFKLQQSKIKHNKGINFKNSLFNDCLNSIIKRLDTLNLKQLRKERMKLSLLCPSRERANSIIKLLDNVYSLTFNPCLVETLFKFDDDDKISINSLIPFKSYFYIRRYIDKRSDKLNDHYYNFLATKAYGKYLWSIGDDVRFHTKHFDTILEEKLEEYLKDKPDRIAYISVTEKGSKAKHPCFPIITKEAFTKLGMYFHPQLLSWGADRCLYEVYSGINRILHIPEIEIEHISYHDNKAPFDKVAQSMKERFFRNPNAHNEVSSTIVPLQIKYLQTIIK